MKIRILAFTILLLISVKASAYFYTGVDLSNLCYGDASKQALCEVYIAGSVDGLVKQQSNYSIALDLFKAKNQDFYQKWVGPGSFCIPPQTTSNQLRLIVIQYLNFHAQRLNYDAVQLINEALLQAFPCIQS